MLKSQELAGRGFETENLAGERTEQRNELGYPKTETIRDSDQEIVRNGQPEKARLWEKRWDYHRAKGDDGAWHDTERVKSIAESKYEYSDNGQTEVEHGQHLMREHDWETTRNFDEKGNLTKEAGKVSAGEKKGEHWEVSVERNQVGQYTEVVKTYTGERAVTREGQTKLESYRTVEVDYRDADNKSVYGWKQMEGDSKSHMEWGAEPADLMAGTSLRKPKDFFRESGS